ncbi:MULTISPECIES: LLM class flavin-dependent oxidoreductase [unclassified Isoptericola]|uniref:LLM class flavin-dependent oxidoreductase n=1 Tax=unclassified Isoptericola TaxID=2623355 RepID=UPI003667E11A
MRFGFVGSFGSPQQMVTLARECEEHGWDGFFSWDGLSMADWGGESLTAWDPFAILAGAAAVTERISLGAMVFAVPRHRAWELAQRALTVDHLSGGRLVLPAGVGVLDDRGFTSVPGQVTDLRERAAKLDETLEFLRRSWSGEQLEADGEHVRTGPFRFAAPPVHGHIPVWPVGVWDAQRPPLRNLRRTLRWDGIVAQVRGATPEEAEAGPDAVRELAAWIAEQRATDGDQGAGTFDIVASGLLPDDRGAAREQARAMADAGATWFIDSWWDPAAATPEGLLDRARQGPPQL